MEVTLRKASQLEKALVEAARKLPMPVTVSVSIYTKSTVADEASVVRSKLLTNIEKAATALEVAFDIRGAINELNSRSGINSRLTEKAKLDAIEKLLTGIGGGRAGGLLDEEDESLEELQAQLDALVARSASPEASRYGAGGNVSANILQGVPASVISDKLIAIKQRKSALADEILTLNMTQKVMLSAKAVEVLKEFKAL